MSASGLLAPALHQNICPCKSIRLFFIVGFAHADIKLGLDVSYMEMPRNLHDGAFSYTFLVTDVEIHVGFGTAVFLSTGRAGRQELMQT